MECLDKQGLTPMFDDETVKQFKRAKTRNLPSVSLDKEVMEVVEPMAPEGKFKVTKTLATEVAQKMNEDPVVIIKYLYALSLKRQNE